jgi:hypothetical protein
MAAKTQRAEPAAPEVMWESSVPAFAAYVL